MSQTIQLWKIWNSFIPSVHEQSQSSKNSADSNSIARHDAPILTIDFIQFHFFPNAVTKQNRAQFPRFRIVLRPQQPVNNA